MATIYFLRLYMELSKMYNAPKCFKKINKGGKCHFLFTYILKIISAVSDIRLNLIA